MERKIICCICGNKTLLNNFCNHLSICLEDAFINENLLETIYKNIFYPENNFQLTDQELKIINEHSSLYFNHYRKYLEKYEMDYSIDDLKNIINNNLDNKNVNIIFNIRCVNCGENYNTDLFINHINNCILNVNSINDNKIFICLLIEIINNLFEEKIDFKYINFLINNYNNFYPLINISHIYCFICGENVLLNTFEIHYSSCKAVFERENSEIKEPEIVDKIIDKLFDDEEITVEELEEYTKKAKILYEKIHSKKCNLCGEQYIKNKYHFCKRRYKKSKTLCDKKDDIKKLFKLIENHDHQEKKIEPKKKLSQQSLKVLRKISTDEVKGFKSFFHCE
jgi:hypothetical protein